MQIADVLQVTCYNLTNYGDPGHFVCKYSGWGDSNCLSVAKLWLKIFSYSTILFFILIFCCFTIHFNTHITFLKSEYKPTIFLYYYLQYINLLHYLISHGTRTLNVKQITSELEYVFIFFLSVFLNKKDS